MLARGLGGKRLSDTRGSEEVDDEALTLAAHEVVETLGAGLGTVRGEGEVVVLEVETNTRKVDLGLDTCGPELRGVTNARSLEDQRGGERAAGNNDLLAGPEDARLQLVRVKRLSGAIIR